MKTIQSVHNPFIKEIAKLKQRKHQLQEQKFLVEGLHLVEEAYKAKYLEFVFKTEAVQQTFDVEEILVSEEVVKKLSSTTTPQGIVGVCRIPSSEIIGKRFLLLDNIQDPGNMGTLFRSASAFGIDTIIVGKDSVSPYNDKSVRATQGSIFHLNIVIGDLYQIMQDLKEKKVMVIGTSLDDAQDLSTLPKESAFAVLLGNEGAGVKPDLLKICDKKVRIQTMRVESLNVAVAGSIILHYLY